MGVIWWLLLLADVDDMTFFAMLLWLSCCKVLNKDCHSIPDCSLSDWGDQGEIILQFI